MSKKKLYTLIGLLLTIVGYIGFIYCSYDLFFGIIITIGLAMSVLNIPYTKKEEKEW